MTENAQLALIGALAAFLTAITPPLVGYLNAMSNRLRSVEKKLDENTVITTDARSGINGDSGKLIARITALESENAALKAAQPKGV